MENRAFPKNNKVMLIILPSERDLVKPICILSPRRGKHLDKKCFHGEISNEYDTKNMNELVFCIL